MNDYDGVPWLGIIVVLVMAYVFYLDAIGAKKREEALEHMDTDIYFNMPLP